MNNNAQRLRDLIEYKERQAHTAESNEKQTILANTQIQAELKKAKEEIKKLSSTGLCQNFSNFLFKEKVRNSNKSMFYYEAT